MLKGLFFSLPSVSVGNTLHPVVEIISTSGYEIICYNTAACKPTGNYNFKFKPYPPYEGGYNPETMNVNSSHFLFGEVLADTAESLMDFLIDEVKREKPDFILHSDLAIWGRLVARHFKIPSITLFNTFILDTRILLPEIKKLNAGQTIDFTNINQGKILYKKIQSLHDKLQLQDKINIWDIYKGELNVAFLLEEFQPYREILGPECKFAGFPINIERESLSHEVIYLALGTVFNNDLEFYRLCINVLKEFKITSILSVGKKIKIEQLGELPATIKIEQFTDQVEILKKAAIFITRGGMASVQEAAYTLTPMIVIPDIPEQRITANKVEELGVGIHLSRDTLTEEILRASIQKILNEKEVYIKNLNSLIHKKRGPEPGAFVCDLLDRQLKKRTQGEVVSH